MGADDPEGGPLERKILRLVRGGASKGQRKGSRAAIEEIFFAVRWSVRGKLSAYRTASLDGMNEDDLVSDIVLALIADDCRALEKFDPKRGSLRAFVGRFADWRCGEIQRRHQRRGGFASLDSAPEVLDSAYDPEEVARGRQAEHKVREHVLGQLSAKEQLAFVRHYDDDLDTVELCRTMGWSPAQVHGFRYRVRNMARSFLREEA